MTPKLLLAAIGIVLASPALAEITVTDAYARSATPMARTGAVYMQLHNDADTDEHLIAVQTDAATRAELHSHTDMGNGVMQMGEIEGGIVIPAHGQHDLKRGGDHVMLMGLTKPLTDGGTVTLILQFQGAEPITLPVQVDQSR